MIYSLGLIIKLSIAIALAVVLGNGSVLVFNKIPVKWFEDWKPNSGAVEERILPDRLLKSISDGRQRVPSTPWKLYFTGFFGITGAFLVTRETMQFTIAVMLMLSVLLLMSISDYLYMLVPDQLIMLLAISAIGFAGSQENWWELPAGALVGFLLATLIWVFGKLIYKTECIGGADIKFYTTMGLVAGRTGIIAIFILTTIFTLIHSLYLKLSKKGPVDKQAKLMIPMMPSAFLATFTYFVFLWDVIGLLSL